MTVVFLSPMLGKTVKVVLSLSSVSLQGVLQSLAKISDNVYMDFPSQSYNVSRRAVKDLDLGYCPTQ